MTFNLAGMCAHFLPRLCSPCYMFLKSTWIVSVNLMDMTCSGDDIERGVVLLFCTLLTFGLIARPMGIFRLGIHPMGFTTHTET